MSDAPVSPGPTSRPVLLVTGLSGAGKTSALKALEDMGYETVDNIPLTFLGALVAGNRLSPQQDREVPLLAIGMDVRTRGFGIAAVVEELDRLRRVEQVEVQVLFLDCDDAELHRRYVETRHRHPLAVDRPVLDGVREERRLLSALRGRADVVLDTSALPLGELKAQLRQHFMAEAGQQLSIFVMSFGFKRGIPRDADLLFDVRFLRNPHYDPALRPLNGRDAPIADFVGSDPAFAPFFDNLTRLIAPLLPRYAAEGKSYLTITLGCTGGRHRSVYTAERLGHWLTAQGHRVQIRHRDLDGQEGGKPVMMVPKGTPGGVGIE
ncbi:RNase adapter RapZ [Magnetospira thiophila]